MRTTLPSTLPSAPPARLLLPAAGAAALVLASALPAAAHVRAVPDVTTAGSYSVVTFRVPNESDTAATTSLVVDLPTATPFTHVAVEPVAGWTATVQEGALPEPVEVSGATITEAPLTVTWTADPGAGGIGVGQFQEFDLQVGPLPAEGTRVVLPAVQTYADGEVSDWSQVADAGAAEPDSPAPEFTTTAATGDTHAAPAGSGESTGGGVQAAPAGSGSTSGAASGGDGVARALGAAGLVLGAAALALALLRRRGTAAG
ncbi:YcnI family copper-binding membrane protein [Kineococcus esterisolvens]|uniref:YcnI family copper-binding membrane protein n=1 Tax=unclassified Kineococcus TaxID=2621656 RepID=UPI003D7D51AE